MNNTQQSTKYLSISNNHIDRIMLKKKTTILASYNVGTKFGLTENQSTFVNYTYKNSMIKIICRGYLTIEEAGGRTKMINSEGIRSVDELMFKQTRDWMEGKGKLWVYDVEPVISFLTIE